MKIKALFDLKSCEVFDSRDVDARINELENEKIEAASVEVPFDDSDKDDLLDEATHKVAEVFFVGRYLTCT